MAIIKVNNVQYLKGDHAIAERKVTFFGVPVFSSKQDTTNTNIVKNLGGIPKVKQCMTIVKGFNYEDKDKKAE